MRGLGKYQAGVGLMSRRELEDPLPQRAHQEERKKEGHTGTASSAWTSVGSKGKPGSELEG